MLLTLAVLNTFSVPDAYRSTVWSDIYCSIIPDIYWPTVPGVCWPMCIIWCTELPSIYRPSSDLYWPTTVPSIFWSTTLWNITGNYASTALFVSHRDIQNINIGNLTGPPPLIPTSSEVLPPYHSPSPAFAPIVSSQSTSSEPGPGVVLPQQQRPAIESPFWLAFIFGNVSRCNGCKGKISRDQNKKLLPPPDDIVFCHKEHVIFHNQRSGMFEQSHDKRNVYYHPWKTCIAPHFSDFDPKKHIVIQESESKAHSCTQRFYLQGIWYSFVINAQNPLNIWYS
jgi:hypothetical protein